MNFRMFNDLVGSAPEASQEFQFMEEKHSAKDYSAKTIENFVGKFTQNLTNFHKISNFLSRI